VTALPTDPAHLRRWAYGLTDSIEGAGSSKDAEVFNILRSTLRIGVLPPDVLGSIYRLMAQIPDVAVKTLEINGELALAVPQTDDWLRQELLLDGLSYEYRGQISTVVKDATVSPEKAGNTTGEIKKGHRAMAAIEVRSASDYDAVRTGFDGMIDRRPAGHRPGHVRRRHRGMHPHRPGPCAGARCAAGGHSAPGFCTFDDGIVIDVRKLDRVDVDPEARTVRCGSGLTWAQLDAATQAHGLAVAGGRVSGTGVTGLTVGGRSGWLERALGLTSDRLIGARLVTADGAVTDTDQDRDLLVPHKQQHPALPRHGRGRAMTTARPAVVITGAAGGIGEAIARRMAAGGARVALIDLDRVAVDALAAELGDRAIPLVADVVGDRRRPGAGRGPSGVRRDRPSGAERGHRGARSGTDGDRGRGLRPRRRGQCPRGVPRTASRAPHRRGRRGLALGRRHRIDRQSQRLGPRRLSASKHAVVALIKTAALEGARLGLRVSSVAPGSIDTPLMRLLEAHLGGDDVARQALCATTPLGRAQDRYGSTADVAELVAFLLRAAPRGSPARSFRSTAACSPATLSATQRASWHDRRSDDPRHPPPEGEARRPRLAPP
jgi:NAD(P)-dependent dehydrogenase (short-subunit alcohol dehydrogenase family)